MQSNQCRGRGAEQSTKQSAFEGLSINPFQTALGAKAWGTFTNRTVVAFGVIVAGAVEIPMAGVPIVRETTHDRRKHQLIATSGQLFLGFSPWVPWVCRHP